MDRSSAPPLRRGALTTAGPEETRDVGRRLGAAAIPGTVLALVGPLGAGKTELAKGVAEGLGVAGIVNSPTFILMNEHVGRLRLWHVDAYRLAEPEDVIAAGLLDERQVEGVTVIEWADRLGAWLPSDRIDLELAACDDPMARELSWVAHGEAHERLAGGALASP